MPGATSEAAGYMYQLALLDESGYPGAWNPVITADLLPLNLDKLLNDPVSVLPDDLRSATSGSDAHPQFRGWWTTR